jgi:hypothetical protein
MPRNVVVLLNTEEGRSLVRRKCRTIGLTIGTFERLIEAELHQQGKQKKRGIGDEFDRILDEEAEESSQ